MAPLHDALQLHRVNQTSSSQEHVYRGRTDKEWAVGPIPLGGYIMSLAVHALTDSQRETKHKDPMQLTAYFLKPAVQGEFEICVSTMRRGKQFTALHASFSQSNEQRVSISAIYTDLSPPAMGARDSTLRPPHPLAPQIPLYSHPATTPPIPETPGWAFTPRLKILRDPYYMAQLTRRAAPQRSGLTLGHWFAWRDPDARITPESLPVFADTFMPLVHFLLEPEFGEHDLWAATVVMHIEFKERIPPPDSDRHSPRTVALYNHGHFVHDPLMRHDSYVELWTAPRLPDDPPLPAGAGQSPEQEAQHSNWRADQRCLAVSYQTAIVLGTRDLGNRKGTAKRPDGSKL